MFHFRNFSFLFKYLAIFLAFIIFFSVAGSVFGAFAAGSFSSTMENFGKTISSVDRAILKPVRDFSKFFGISSPGYGGSAFVYERTPDDPIYSDLIPSNSAYCSVFTPFTLSADFLVTESFFIIVFYDSEGSPITGYLNANNRIRNSGYVFKGGITFDSLDVSRCFYNRMSKYEYLDIDLYYTQISSRKITFRQDSALVDYSYSGNFFDVQGWLIE